MTSMAWHNLTEAAHEAAPSNTACHRCEPTRHSCMDHRSGSGKRANLASTGKRANLASFDGKGSSRSGAQCWSAVCGG